MTQDEIIRMAREAGFSVGLDDPIIYAAHERFAALVAAHEREKLKNVAIFSKWYEELDKAVLAEREACAKVCEELINEETCYVWIPDARGAVNNCAAAIRARREK